MRISRNKDLDKLAKSLLRDPNWVVHDLSSSHKKLRYLPTNAVQVVPFSPSDHRAVRNFRNQIKKIQEFENGI